MRKYTASAKKLFNAAIEHELIEANPFGTLKSSMVEARERQFFIGREDAAKVLDACPSLDWRLIVALARWGGLRCPSEVLRLRWADVQWDKQRFIVHASKTEHHEGRGTRVVPIFPELAPLLSEAFEAADDGAEYVVTMTRDAGKNLRKPMTTIIERAGLRPWPKLFQNLRATRATELADEYPEHVAAAWLGHCVKVARDHYWQVTDEHFERATKSAANALQKVSADTRNELQPERAESLNAVSFDLVQLLSTCPVGDTGFEPVTSAV